MKKFKLLALLGTVIALGGSLIGAGTAIATDSMTPVHAANATGGTYFYLKPNSNWTQSNAWFAMYGCNGSSAAEWVKLTKVEGETIYYGKFKAGSSHKNIIFCRMNSADTTTLDWGNKWNQTGDLTWGGTNRLCSINSGQWDAGTNVTWSSVTQYTITYNSNGGSGTAPSQTKQDKYLAHTISGSNGLTKTDYDFAGWNTVANGSGTTYQENQTLKISANTTLYAKWNVKQTYTVTYDANGVTGTVPTDEKKYNSGDTLTIPDNVGKLVKPNHYFAGWNTAADGSGTTYAVGSTVTIRDNIKLYAKWNKGYVLPGTHNGWAANHDQAEGFIYNFETERYEYTVTFEKVGEEDVQFKLVNSNGDWIGMKAGWYSQYFSGSDNGNIILNGGYEGEFVFAIEKTAFETATGTDLNVLKVISAPQVKDPFKDTKLYLNTNIWYGDVYFAAYFYNSFGDEHEWVVMEETNVESVYSVMVPENEDGWESVIFCRMNPEYEVPGWDVGTDKNGNGERDEGEDFENHVFNQTDDLYKAGTNVVYTVTTWHKDEADDTSNSAGTWSESTDFKFVYHFGEGTLVYMWTEDLTAQTSWPGVALNTSKMIHNGEKPAKFVVFNEDYEKFLFHNNNNYKSGDLTLPGSGAFDAADKSTTLEIVLTAEQIEYIVELTTTLNANGGSACGLDKEIYDGLSTKYDESLNDESLDKASLNDYRIDLHDGTDATYTLEVVHRSMNTYYVKHFGGEGANKLFAIIGDDNSTMIIVVASISLLVIAGVAFIYYRKRRQVQ